MEQLGIEPQLFIAQLVNFLIILFVLSKLLYKPILGMLEKRKKEIAQGLALTEKMREEEEKLKSKEDKLMIEARREARNIVEAGEKEADLVKKDIIGSAQKEAAAIVAKGKADILELRVRMEKDVRKAAVELATAMVRRLLTGVLTPADQHKLLTKHLKELDSVKS